MQHLSFTSIALCGLAATAAAQGPDVAIVAAATTSLTACQFTDVQAKLQASGFFNTVDIVDCVTQTPTLQQLQAYDAIISWSNSSYQSGAALGDVFADYVDAGGGVVLAVYATSTLTANRSLTGRWSQGYDVIEPRSGNTTGAVTLGTVLQPTHPVMAGVALLSSTQGARPTTTNLLQGQLLAEWSDGKILAAVGANPRRVDLGLYPPSNACTSTFWDQNTDGGRLMANALLFVATAGGPTQPGSNYCTANNNSTGSAASMSATGSNQLLDNNVVLAASGLPNNAFGFFLTSTTQGFIANPGGSQGNLCLGGAIGRYVGPGQIKNSGATGAIDLAINVNSMPSPSGSVIVAPGQTWNFTAWYRDTIGGAATSNFADGYAITFQ